MENHRRKRLGRVVKTILFGLFVLCLQVSLTVAETAATINISKNNYEQGILNTIKDIQRLNHQQALDSTRHLIQQYPHSRLGQMLYADLLLAKAKPLAHIGLGLKTDQAARDFKHEIRQRWQHKHNTAYASMYPENILFLADSQPYVILVDLRNSRIYIYRNDQGIPVLETDYFISIGLQGSGKQKRGDQKTPIGIYHITQYIDGEELPDLYGAGAFPISYPNVWDKRRHRTGDGIWIHGTPAATYNRSPWASDGCIVVSNPDFQHIYQYIKAGIHTPVVVTEQVNWLTQVEWQTQRQQWLQTISQWINDWQSLDHMRYRSHYSQTTFKSQGRDFNDWDDYKRRVNHQKSYIHVEYSDLNAFNYPGETDLVLMQFQQNYSSNNFNSISPKELYWRKHDQQWKIVYEGPHKFPGPGSALADVQLAD